MKYDQTMHRRGVPSVRVTVKARDSISRKFQVRRLLFPLLDGPSNIPFDFEAISDDKYELNTRLNRCFAFSRWFRVKYLLDADLVCENVPVLV